MNHLRTLKAIKPTINNTPPQVMRHLVTRAKEKHMKKQQEASITKANKKLLQKMLEIDQQSQKSFTQHLVLYNHTRVERDKQIRAENKQIVHKLRKVKSNYSLDKWNKDYEKKRYLSNQISNNPRRRNSSSNLDITYKTRPVSAYSGL